MVEQYISGNYGNFQVSNIKYWKKEFELGVEY